MRDSVRLGRIAGFPVSINWSVLVVLLLLAWSLAEGVLPTSAPGRGTGTYWLAGVVGSLLLLCSLMAHELAHAIVATRSGVESTPANRTVIRRLSRPVLIGWGVGVGSGVGVKFGVGRGVGTGVGVGRGVAVGEASGETSAHPPTRMTRDRAISPRRRGRVGIDGGSYTG